MMKKYLLASAAAMMVALPANAATVMIDLSGASTGSLITAPGASFAQIFTGQTVSGIGVTGSPTGPLSLASAGSITVSSFNPGVSPASNSLLSQPGNVAPFSILLDSLADSFTFTMGSSVTGSTVNVSAFDVNGATTGTTQINMLSGYNIYNLASLGNFRGLTFADNNDPSGVRFQNMSYNSVMGGAVPEPATWAFMIFGFGAIGGALRSNRRRQRKANVKVSYA